ncbi:MAG: fasciclin domain-containing protein, partial [Proteobacteria bacterium]|nr:fasciclin domain-containing protein [Pseudomonadota bacterium]
VGFRVAGRQPAAFKEGDWVVVRGYVKKLPRFVSSPNIRLGVAMFSQINEEFIIDPVQVVSLASTYPSLIEELDSERSADFFNALKVAGLLEKIDAKGPFTLFVPHQQAFDTIDFDPFDGSLPAKERQAVNRWLTKHIMVGKHTRKQLFYQESLQTIDGRQIGIRADNGRLILEDSRVLLSDIT